MQYSLLCKYMNTSKTGISQSINALSKRTSKYIHNNIMHTYYTHMHTQYYIQIHCRTHVKTYTIVVERLPLISMDMFTTGPLPTLPQPPRSSGSSSIFDSDTLPAADLPKKKKTGESFFTQHHMTACVSQLNTVVPEMFVSIIIFKEQIIFELKTHRHFIITKY